MNERLNIRRMQVPEREDRENEPFDPEIDIKESDFQRTFELIERYRAIIHTPSTERKNFADVDIHRFFDAVATLKLLDPERGKAIPLSREEFEEGKKTLNKYWNESPVTAKSLIGQLYVVFPEY